MAKWPLPAAAAALPRVGGARLCRVPAPRSASARPRAGGAAGSLSGSGGGGTAWAAGGSRWPPARPPPPPLFRGLGPRRMRGGAVGANPGVLRPRPVLLGKAPEVLRQSAVAALLRQAGCSGSDLLGEAESRSETERERQNPG